ncbi:sulfotransferase [Lutimaribacter marinistellae]|uniref:Sulfotransferase n=1 Tax=Lutimaribacter marinistellae TaxID=1820329 RepID=A0ABV7TJ18_9RHOB
MTSEITKLQKYDALDGRTFLICVGAMKCATTWLYHYLASLEGVVVSPVKELHFFSAKFPAHALSDMDALAMHRLGHHIAQEGDAVENLMWHPTFRASVDRVQMIYDDDAYFGHFARLCTSETKTLCDITPAYSTIGPDGFVYMRDFCASQEMRVKILFVMRDPVDRLWSQLRHITQTNPEAELTKRWAEALQMPKIMVRSDYRYIVQDIDEVFPHEDVLYLFYEDLFEESTLRQLCAFADAAYVPGNVDTVHHRTELRVELPGDARDAFRRALSAEYRFARERFGDRIPSAWLP